MLKLIVDMKEEQGMHVLVCSHLLRDIEQVCDVIGSLVESMP